MANILAQAMILIRADSGQLKGDLKDAEKEAVNSLSGLQGALGGFFGGLAATLGIQAISGMLSATIGEAERAAASYARLEAVINATGGSAKLSAEEMANYAGELQNNTTFGDDEIMEAMAQLTTFKSVAGDTFKEATRLALDLSATGFGSVQSATMQLGKALEDPVQGINALRRAGVSFSDEEKKRIKLLAESNRLHEAQQIVLNAVAGQVQGVAESLAKTPSGKVAQLRNLYGDLQEVMGARLMPVQIALLRAQIATQHVMNAMVAPIGAAVEGFLAFEDATGGLASKLATSLTIATGITFLLPKLVTGIGLVSKAIQAATALSGWGLVVIGIGAAVYGVIQLYEIISKAVSLDSLGTLGDQFHGMWEQVKAAAGGIWNTITQSFLPLGGLIQSVVTAASAAWERNFGNMQRLIVLVANVVTNAIKVVESVVMAAGSLISNVFQQTFGTDLTSSVTTGLGAAIDGVVSFVMNSLEWIVALQTNWSTVWNAFPDIAKLGLMGVIDMMMFVRDAIPQLLGYGLRKAFDFFIAFGSSVIELMAQIVSAIATGASHIPSLIEAALQDAAGLSEGGSAMNRVSEMMVDSLTQPFQDALKFGEGLTGELPQFDGFSKETQKQAKHVRGLLDPVFAAKKDLEANRDKLFQTPATAPAGGKAPADAPVAPKPIALDIKPGFFDFSGWGQKLQEAMLGNSKEQNDKKMLSLAEANQKNQEKQIAELRGIRENIGLGGGLAAGEGV